MQGGNFNNFRKLVEATSPFAYSVALRMLGNDDQAKDVVQETMVTIWQKLKIKSAEVYQTWIYRIVVNKCYDQLRKRKRNMEIIMDDKAWAVISNTVSQEPGTSLGNSRDVHDHSSADRSAQFKAKSCLCSCRSRRIISR